MDIEPYIQQGWQFSEFATWIPIEEKENFLEMIGQENVLVLDQTLHPYRKKWKGRMLISPLGIQILNLLFIPPAGHA